MEKSKVYFIKDITPENIIKAYEAVGKKLEGNVAVKIILERKVIRTI